MFKPKHRTANASDTFSEFGAVTKIHVRFFFAACVGFLAFKLWPSEIENWGFGVIAACLGTAAAGQAARGLRETLTVLKRDRALRKHVGDAVTTKHAREITNDVLRDAGMK